MVGYSVSNLKVTEYTMYGAVSHQVSLTRSFQINLRLQAHFGKVPQTQGKYIA